MSTEFVVARTPLAPLAGEPRASSTQISQILHGHRAAVLARDGKWLRVRGGDDYEGWIHQGYVEPCDSLSGADWGWNSEGEMSLGCSIRDDRGATLDLPLGALIGPARRISGRSLDLAHRRETFPKDAEAVVASAMGLFQGTYYQWGGVSPWGTDCSGLVQSAFALHGVRLPRDAWQQASVGEDVAGGLDAMKPADLLFFRIATMVASRTWRWPRVRQYRARCARTRWVLSGASRLVGRVFARACGAIPLCEAGYR